MLRIARVAVCAGVAVLTAGTVRPAAWQQPTFKSATALVEVDAVVLDKDGNFVPGLKLEDITLLENGKPQKIQQFFMVTNNQFGMGTAIERHSAVPDLAPTQKAARPTNPASPRSAPRGGVTTAAT